MNTTTEPSNHAGRIRHRLGRRLLLALAAIVLYAIVALVLAAALPPELWPPLGDGEFSSAQATIVPALNLFALGAIVLAILQPVLPAAALIVLDILLGVAAAAAGPGMAFVTGEGADVITVGTLALAATGVAVARARTILSRRTT